MEYLGNFKIIKHKAKANIVYPLIRLPQSRAQLIGQQAHVFETKINGKTLFLVSLDEEFKEDSIVIQPKSSKILEERVEELERKVRYLESNLQFR